MEISNIEWTVQLRFLIALGLGFLIGLERESIKIDRKLIFGGVRTHPIISMFGFGCALLYNIGVTFALPVGLLSIAILTAIAYIAKINTKKFGTTSEVSALLTFIIGALAMLVDVWIPMALGIINTFLLSEKAMLESYVERLNKVDFLATVKFLLVTLIILPVLPDKEFTQFNINPTKIWHIVIIVSTLGFVGYLLEKKFGPKLGLWMSGTLGGIVSSTAMTISMGRMARQNQNYSQNALQGALLASSVMYLRVLVLIWIINPYFVGLLWHKLLILTIVGIGLSLSIKTRKVSDEEKRIHNLQNPFEIRPALVFAVLFVVLSILINLLKVSLGDTGILGLSALVGVVDVDPFVLSLTQGSSNVEGIYVSAIILALMSNTIAKGVYFSILSKNTRNEAIIKYLLFAIIHIPLVIL